jgi:hypothetical protein
LEIIEKYQGVTGVGSGLEGAGKRNDIITTTIYFENKH